MNIKIKTNKIRNKLSVITSIIIIASLSVLMTGCFQPTKDSKRNVSTSDVKMEMSVEDPSDRTPIIRTYTKDEYSNLDKKELIDVKNTVNGKAEGDIPRNYLGDGKEIVKFTFTKDGEKMKLDSDPVVKFELYPDLMMPYKENPPYEVRNLDVELDKEDDYTYTHEMERYVVQREKYFIQLNFIEVEFKLDDKEYVAITALQSSNLEDANKLFENEELPEPIQPEV